MLFGRSAALTGCARCRPRVRFDQLTADFKRAADGRWLLVHVRAFVLDLTPKFLSTILGAAARPPSATAGRHRSAKADVKDDEPMHARPIVARATRRSAKRRRCHGDYCSLLSTILKHNTDEAAVLADVKCAY